MAVRLRSHVARALSRIPGRHAVTVWTWGLPLVLALTMIPFTTSGPRAFYWQYVSIQAFAIVGLVSAALLLLARPLLGRLRATAYSGVVSLIAYALVATASVSAAIAVLPPLRATDRPTLLGSAASILLYAVASTGAGGVAAWTLSWRAGLQRALRDSRLRAAQAKRTLEKQREVDARLRAEGVDSVIRQVEVPLSALRTELVSHRRSLVEAAAELRALAIDVVRPLSHSLHPVEASLSVVDSGTIGDGVSWRAIYPLRRPLPVFGIWLLSVPGAVLIPATGPGPLWAAIPDLGVLAMGLLALRWLLRDPGDTTRTSQWLLLISGLAVVGAAAGVAFAIALGEAWFSLVVTGAAVHMISGVAITLAHGWGSAMRMEAQQAQREALVSRTALAAEIVSIDAARRHAADILHSQVQTRLLAISDLLDFAARGDSADLSRAQAELTSTCEETIPHIVRVLAGDGGPPPSFADLVLSTWPDIEIRGAGVIDSLQGSDGILVGVALDACANAIHHGGATVIEILQEHRNVGSLLLFRDNGRGVDADIELGLGLSAVAVHFPGWSLSTVNGWTELALPLSRDHLRGEPANAR